MARLKQVAEELGLTLGKRKKTYNSRLAQELAKWAESKGRGDLWIILSGMDILANRNTEYIPLLDITKSIISL